MITTLYATLIFYLSVTADLWDLKNFLKMNLGYTTRDVLASNDLSFITDFLLDALNFAISISIDPGHVVIYFGFGVLLYFVFLNSKNPKLVKYAAVYAISAGTAYGILNEIFQMYLPFRVASMADAMSNLLGLILAQIFVIIFASGLRGISRMRETQE
ncbi:hypothetical protein FTO70_07230 [Methanosarcina sp. KYL-1]|uniref:VanZ family protein n=1 Tax=Methanosarcina sp. KYL-1 TaxID=2602068 RepID=UPI002100B606|nr:VanZ family protein [Methanosarcina sp. KYL-1]MCQ1535480.1 hypothetical protein [Methanosarcina sp. KYL-1]